MTPIAKWQSPEPREGFLSAGDSDIYYRISGTGEPLVVLHGGPGLSHDYQAPFLDQLLGDRLQLLHYDQRGSGRSSGASTPSRLTMETFVADLDTLRRTLNLGCMNLAGHSFGGLLAMHYAAKYPRHLRSLILIDSEAASSELRDSHMARVIDARLTDDDQRRLAELEEQPGFAENPELVSKHLATFTPAFFYDRSLADRLPLGGDANAKRRFLITNRAVRQDLGKYDIHGDLARIDCPTLILQGDSSPLSVEGAEAIQRNIAGARLVVLEECGHFIYLERPKEFRRAVLEFFRDLEAP